MGEVLRLVGGVWQRVDGAESTGAAAMNPARTEDAGEAETAPAGVCTGLAALPRHAHLDARALATILGRTVRTIDRATARSELPAPVRLLGRRTWLVGAILDHFEARQQAALEAAARHERKILEHSA